MSVKIIAGLLALATVASQGAIADTRYNYIIEGRTQQTGEAVTGTFSLTVPSVLPAGAEQRAGTDPDGRKWFRVDAPEDSNPANWFLNWTIQWPEGETARLADYYTGAFVAQTLLPDGTSTLELYTSAAGEAGRTGSGASQNLILTLFSDSSELFQGKLGPLPLDKVKLVRGQLYDNKFDQPNSLSSYFTATLTPAVPEPSQWLLGMAGLLVVAATASRRRGHRLQR